jgi:antitoxin component YwqK of YwqJK toxin-antitoxin module
MKRIFTTLIFVIPLLGYSNSLDKLSANSEIAVEGVDPQANNQKDANGWKQGWWVIYGKDMPEKGYPETGKIEEGNYKDDKKTGEWTMYHTDGVTIRTKGNFENGRPKGPYIKFDETGAKKEEGNYANGKQSGSLTMYYPNGQIAQQKTFNAEGKEEGPVTFYYENGQKQFEFVKANGVTTGEATRYWEDGSVKEKITYGAGGEVVSTVVVNEAPASGAVVAVETGSGGPSGAGGVTKDGKKFAADGYNKLYNKDDELWMDGTFKGGKLWDGKLYKYDSDGILLKIEIWKNGAYHSDGQL